MAAVLLLELTFVLHGLAALRLIKVFGAKRNQLGHQIVLTRTCAGTPSRWGQGVDLKVKLLSLTFVVVPMQRWRRLALGGGGGGQFSLCRGQPRQSATWWRRLNCQRWSTNCTAFYCVGAHHFFCRRGKQPRIYDSPEIMQAGVECMPKRR